MTEIDRADADAYDRRADAAKRAYERWRAKWPEAARELEQIQGPWSEADRARFHQTYPEAAREHVGLTLFSEEVMRKMRMAVPSWEPPDPEQIIP